MSTQIHVSGTHGGFTFDASSGVITSPWRYVGIDYRGSSQGWAQEGIHAEEYEDIALIDVTHLPAWAKEVSGHIDILDCPFITTGGQYVREVPLVEAEAGGFWHEEPYGLLTYKPAEGAAL